ncbi:MAG: DUF2845 domain-containing protein [Myxococcales bacterium]|nr:MAG: DUF2845 domain-containing protein [Myxococcales bacterium]
MRSANAERGSGWVFAFLLLAGLTTSASARADSLGCKGRIVSSGDTRYEVKAVCGEPDDASQRVEYRTLRGRVAGPCTRQGDKIVCSQTREQVVEVVIDEWLYDFGRNRFIQHLLFEQGKLVSVTSGGYGHKPPAGG